MSINLNKNRETLKAAWKDVLDAKTDTNWALFGYEGLSNDLKFISKGDGGLEELVDDLNSGKIMYAFLKIDIPDASISKFVLINWQGEGAPTVVKGTCANHVKDVANFFTGFHLTMHARTEDDLDIKVILANVAKAGSAFNFKQRTEELPSSGPIGTVYQKVNPGKEINSQERDQFWLKEEQEEKKRIETDRRRKTEEQNRAEAELQKRNAMKAASNLKDDALRPNEVSPTGGMSASDALRRQRSAEAKQLIGHSTSNARAIFEQNCAKGQMNNKNRSVVPEKPIRSSVIAQRINSLQQQAQPPSRPTEPHRIVIEQPQETRKTSPIKPIDKIKMSLESPSQIQHEPILDPTTDLSPGTDSEHSSFSSINYGEKGETAYRTIKNDEPMVKQNILKGDVFDAAQSSGNEYDDEDSDDKFSTIKRSPYSKNNISDDVDSEMSRQNTVIETVNYKNSQNGSSHEDGSPDTEDDVIYQDLDEDPGLTARALYDYQAADETEITFDPGDIITHIEQIDEGWWQGLGPHGEFGLFPANYVELLPCIKQ